MMLKDSRVLVIGGAGFIGSHVVDLLLERSVGSVVVLDNFKRGSRRNIEAACQDQRVNIVEGSITEPQLLRDVMQGTDYVFHLAALWLYECVHEPRSAVEVNVVGTYNVIEAAQRAAVRKVVYSSSASVYGDAAFTPMTEDHPFHNRTTYGATKIAGEQLFRAFYEQHGLDYVGLRYMNVYGPRMDYEGAYVSVIMKILDRLEEGLSPRVFGDGTQAYDFVHVRDVARANVLAMEGDATDGCFNVGTGSKTTINELVAKLLWVTGSNLQPEYVPQEQMFVTHRVGSTERAEQFLRFRADVPLEEGLRTVVEWRNGDRLRHPPERATGA